MLTSLLFMFPYFAPWTHVGLIAAMCCVGACYLDNTAPSITRDLMELLSSVIENSSLMLFSATPNSRSGVNLNWDSFGDSLADLEELQAISIVQILLTWHGTPAQ